MNLMTSLMTDLVARRSVIWTMALFVWASAHIGSFAVGCWTMKLFVLSLAHIGWFAVNCTIILSGLPTFQLETPEYYVLVDKQTVDWLEEKTWRC